MPPKQLRKLDKNFSPTCKRVAGLGERKSGMLWRDRIRYWLLSIAGVAIAGAGIAIMAYLRQGKVGGGLVALGIVVYFLGSPSQSARNGYHD